MFVVGVDGGTTKTIALVADTQGNILSAARGKGSNWTGENVQTPMAVVSQTVREALEKAGLGGEDVALGLFALAGADRPEDHLRWEEVLAKAGIARQVKVKNDSFGGMRAGLRKPYGMVLAAGTGLNAAVITPDGREWAFGYYETFGGAGSIAQDSYTAVLRAEDGRGKPTLLTRMMLECLGCPSVEAMLRASVANQIDPGKFYAVAPLTFQAALSGDPVAVEIIVRQGKGLAEYITAMARRFDMSAIAFDVVLAGSVFKGAGPLLIDTITAEIHQAAPYAKIVRAQFEPAVGSLLLAYDSLGVEVSDEVYTRLAETAPNETLFDTSRGSRPTALRAEENREEA